MFTCGHYSFLVFDWLCFKILPAAQKCWPKHGLLMLWESSENHFLADLKKEETKFSKFLLFSIISS